MKSPIAVRPLTGDERDLLETGPRSSSAFSLRRCQILLASARGECPPQIATSLGYNDQTARNVTRRSHRPETKLDGVAAEQVRALLHQSPRTLGLPTSLWTLERAAEVSFVQGITTERVSGETIRHGRRLGVKWKQAKQWITSPDPAYARKKGHATV